SARIRRLTRLELQNTLGDLLGDEARALATDIEPDTFAIGYSTGDERGVSSNYVDALKAIAEKAAPSFGESPEAQALTASCYADETSSSACAKTFLQSFGAHAWRRPVEQVELDGLLTVYAAGRATVVGGDEQATTTAGLDYAVRALLQSPN